MNLICLYKLYWTPISMTSHIITDNNFAHWNPLLFLNLSSRCSDLSRVLSPGHANESVGFCSEGLEEILYKPAIGSILIYFKII